LERIRFHFEGGLADAHHLNFYEAARFQYAAARLTTKLMQFQSYGRFTKRITDKSNTDVLLETHQDGSFDISILVPLAMAAAETFVTVPVGHLMSYVFERLLGKSSDSDVVAALNAQAKVAEQFGRISDNDSETMQKALDIIEAQRQDYVDVTDRYTQSLERRLAELDREKVLEPEREQFARIDQVRQEKLISMAAPLVSEMATALRRSADKLEIFDESVVGQPKRLLYLDQDMAEEIMISRVDDHITSIRVDIVQYNKETGWGKLRLATSRDLIAFSVPSDIKARLQARLMQEMRKKQTFVQVYYVRDQTREIKRLLLVGVIDEST
jgi:hypothetical protein